MSIRLKNLGQITGWNFKAIKPINKCKKKALPLNFLHLTFKNKMVYPRKQREEL